MKNRVQIAYSSNRADAKLLALQEIAAILSPKKKRRPLPSLLYNTNPSVGRNARLRNVYCTIFKRMSEFEPVSPRLGIPLMPDLLPESAA